MNKNIHLLKTFIKETFSNKVDVFFTIAFPLLFLLIFGMVFGNTSASSENIVNIGLYNIEIDNLKAYFENSEFVESNNLEDLKTQLKSQKIDAIITKPDNYEIFIREGSIDPQETSFIKNTISNGLSYAKLNRKEIFLEQEFISVSLGDTDSGQTEYLLTGILSISLLSGGMFSVIGIFGRYKKNGIIKKFMSAPVSPSSFVVNASISKLILNIFSVIILIIFAKLMYNLNYQFNWAEFSLVILTSSLGMMGFGVILLIIFKRIETASTAASLLFVIMTFFSGIYFPLTLIPEQIRWISYFMPVTYVVNLVRHSANVENIGNIEFLLTNLVLLTIGVVFLIVASNKYVKQEI
ncbi:ABC transporter permease [Geotoga petraea]|jgi:ABC-2 type transport system permease protein|uniref:ABC transporter permease n=1 Tax=Geotoga petraea TaxID=28234 RepID=A0A1G6I070_9BACT|nr:ABC transporter permease [Geotoga petraea]MDK2945431.1 type transport system permease protein [Geotoga sp.]TGG89040.1 ABC transporter permease [Geotoga petraea]SDB99788.1 ABC-2 type transport system permease protein [Geotoga petraea]